MNQYKVVKSPSYESVYRIYSRWFCFWSFEGSFTYHPCTSSIEEQARDHLKKFRSIKEGVFFEA
jgi:hypothetical protein